MNKNVKIKIQQMFLDFQLMYLILDSINSENPKDNIIKYLSDANPYMRDGEYSVDLYVYEDFKDKYYKNQNHDDYSYEFIYKYLKEIDYYEGLLDMFILITKEEYINDCNEIILKY